MAAAGLALLGLAYIVAETSSQSVEPGFQTLAFFAFLMLTLAMAPMCHVIGLVMAASARSLNPPGRVAPVLALILNLALMFAGPVFALWVWRGAAS